MLCAFDFDGTLADSKAAYYDVVRGYSNDNGLKLPSKAEIDMVFGAPDPDPIEGWGAKAAFHDHLQNIFSLLDDVLYENPHCMPLYEGVAHLMEDLRQAGHTLSIVTSRNLKPLMAVLKEVGIDGHFKTIRSAQDMIEKGYRGKPHPDKLNSVLKELNCTPDQAIMVGDTFMDMKMAKNSGVFALGVTWGYHPKDVLLKNGADATASSTSQIKEIVKQRGAHTQTL